MCSPNLRFSYKISTQHFTTRVLLHWVGWKSEQQGLWPVQRQCTAPDCTGPPALLPLTPRGTLTQFFAFCILNYTRMDHRENASLHHLTSVWTSQEFAIKTVNLQLSTTITMASQGTTSQRRAVSQAEGDALPGELHGHGFHWYFRK